MKHTVDLSNTIKDHIAPTIEEHEQYAKRAKALVDYANSRRHDVDAGFAKILKEHEHPYWDKK